ncbi:MAG: hypothetical protein LBV23_03830 [Deltaproteobacteria bacterium]|nr:hypothetical protein [Deltaproteobacteria bacterium]
MLKNGLSGLEKKAQSVKLWPNILRPMGHGQRFLGQYIIAEALGRGETIILKSNFKARGY